MRTPNARHTQRPTVTILRLVTALLAGALLLAGCSSAMETASDEPAIGRGAAEGESAGDAQAGADGGGQVGMDDSGAELAAPAAAAALRADAADLAATAEQQAEGRMIARDAALSLRVGDVVESAARVRAAGTTAGGWVTSEEVQPGGGEGGDGFATIVLSVPSESLEETMDQVTAIGEVTSRTVTTADVTAEFVDVQARIETLEASVARLRTLVEEASSVDEIARLEAELSGREADLDALKARRNAIQEDVSRSSLTVHLAENAEALAAVEPATGFLAGLRAGWDAFVTSLTGLVTVVGAVLPFTVLAAMVLVAIWWWRRRAAGRAPAAPASDGPTPANA